MARGLMTAGRADEMRRRWGRGVTATGIGAAPDWKAWRVGLSSRTRRPRHKTCATRPTGKTVRPRAAPTLAITSQLLEAGREAVPAADSDGKPWPRRRATRVQGQICRQPIEGRGATATSNAPGTYPDP